MSIVWVAFSVTARILPFGLNATWAAPTPEPDRTRRELAQPPELALAGDADTLDRVGALVHHVDERAVHVDAHGTVAHPLLVGQLEASGRDVEDRHVVAAGVDGEQVIAVGRDRQRGLAAEAGRGAAAAGGDGFLVGERSVRGARERDHRVAGRRVRLNVDVSGGHCRECRTGVRQLDRCERQPDHRESGELRDTRHATTPCVDGWVPTSVDVRAPVDIRVGSGGPCLRPPQALHKIRMFMSRHEIAVGSTEGSDRLRHPIEPPAIGDSLQLVLAGVLERESGARDQVLDRLRDHDL